jgi:ATP-dependent DNA helicase RecG
MKKKHPSIPFNPDVANAFFRAGMIEAWGRGTVKIINDCKKTKTPTPSYKYDMSGFIMEFEYVPVNTTINKISKSSAMSEKIIAHISQNENITIPELSRQLAVSLITIKRILQTLQLENKIERICSDKTGIWKIINL